MPYKDLEKRKLRQRKVYAGNHDRLRAQAKISNAKLRQLRKDGKAPYRPRKYKHLTEHENLIRDDLRRKRQELRNKSKRKKQRKEWGERNRNRLALSEKRWRQNNPDDARLQQRNQWHKRRSTEKRTTARERQKVISWEKEWKSKPSVECFWCENYFAPKECQSDHVIAVSIGGRHELYNLVISCAFCNLRKSAKLPLVWMREIGKMTDRIWCS